MGLLVHFNSTFHFWVFLECWRIMALVYMVVLGTLMKMCSEVIFTAWWIRSSVLWYFSHNLAAVIMLQSWHKQMSGSGKLFQVFVPINQSSEHRIPQTKPMAAEHKWASGSPVSEKLNVEKSSVQFGIPKPKQSRGVYPFHVLLISFWCSKTVLSKGPSERTCRTKCTHGFRMHNTCMPHQASD